jgi:hypothetical protein
MSSKYLRQASAFAAAGVLSLMTGMVWAEEKPSGHPSTPETEMRYKGAPVPLKPEEAKETVAPEAPGLSKAQGSDRQAVDTRYHPKKGNPIPGGFHQLWLPGGDAQLGHVR